MERISDTLKKKLIALADKYETAEFIHDDPSKFMHRYTKQTDQEIMAFISANLAFGRRDQILSHTETICGAIKAESHNSPCEWISEGSYKKLFTNGKESFYRMMSHDTMLVLCGTLKDLLEKYGSFGDAVKSAYMASPRESVLSQTISDLFPKECAIIAHGKTCCAKRLQMFLRWMVRENSPVDLGLWGSWYDKKNLLMPLDTHVMQQSVGLGLIERTKSGKIPSPSLKLAQELTEKLKEVFPEDPVRADFALFGLGVNS